MGQYYVGFSFPHFQVKTPTTQPCFLFPPHFSVEGSDPCTWACVSWGGSAPLAAHKASLYLGSCSQTLPAPRQLQQRCDPPLSEAGLQTGRTRFPKQKVITSPAYCGGRSWLFSRTTAPKDEPLDNYLRTRSRRHAEKTEWNATQGTLLSQIFKTIFFRLH